MGTIIQKRAKANKYAQLPNENIMVLILKYFQEERVEEDLMDVESENKNQENQNNNSILKYKISKHDFNDFESIMNDPMNPGKFENM